jgi:twinkle protein
VEKLPHRTDKCNSANGLQVFDKGDGTYDGYCFSCGTYVPNPYSDKPAGYRPASIVKSKEEIQAEIKEIGAYRCVDLPDRKLKKEYLNYFGVKIGVSETDGETPVTHYYPYYISDELIGYKVRLIENKRMWAIGSTKGADFFGWNKAVQTGGKKLFVTEGELDAVALFQIFKEQNKGTQYADLNPAVVSLSNGAGGAARQFAKMLPEIRKHFKEIILVFDNDGPGKQAVEDVLKLAPEALVATLPSKDANQCLIDGRNKAAYNACQFNAQKPKNTRLVSASSVIEDARKETEWGFSYPFPALTDLTRGQRMGETVYWGAGVKMGKSELLNALVAHNIMEHGWKVFVIKPEESNKRTLQGVVGKVANRIFHDPKIPFDYAAFDEAVPKIQDKLLMMNLYQELSWENLQLDIRAAAAEGCKAIYIDPITVLTNGVAAADANTLLQKFAQGLAQMAMDLNIIVHIFCHLKAPDTGPPHERGGVVQSYQFAGSRAMMRACNSMIGMEGNKDPNLSPEERNIRELVVLEDRATGSSGKLKLYYDMATGSFNQINQ